ncbi:MAG: hypothetical protein WCK39_05295 [Methanomassiliicoccales archaeon]
MDPSPDREAKRARVLLGAVQERHRCDTCAALLGRGERVCYCPCGAIHHHSCLSSLGYCPLCSRETAAASLRTEHYDPARPRGELCQNCGRSLPAQGRCPCGAMAVAPSGAFDCPACGGRVFGSEMHCSSCGAEFSVGGVVPCPSCGRTMPSELARCDCGRYLGDRCRRCGLLMRKDDRVCSRCGRRSDRLD